MQTMQKNKPPLRRVLTLLLSFIMVVALAFSTATTALAADDKQAELKQQRDSLKAQLEALNTQLDSIQNTAAEAEQKRALLEERRAVLIERIGVINAAIDDLIGQIDNKQVEIDNKQVEIDNKQAEYDARWAGFKERMAAMQMLNDGGAIALLSSATNLYELLTFSQTLEEMSSKDQEICQRLENQRIDLANQRQELENDKLELEANVASLSEQQADLNNTQEQLASNMQQLDADITAAEAEAAALSDTITDAQREYNEAADAYNAYLTEQNRIYGNAAINCSLNFICPLPTYRYISCQYGANGHKGVDFAAPGNTPIYTIADGVVTASGFHYSYGNYVQVFHGTDDNGNTYATLYAHMIQTPSVSVGQAVSQGDTLGYVGSTGNSTGNHLHLELRVNNARTNPLNYVPH